MMHPAGRRKFPPKKHKTQRMLGFVTILSYFVKAPYGDHTGWLSELLEDKLLIEKSLQDLEPIVN